MVSAAVSKRGRLAALAAVLLLTPLIPFEMRSHGGAWRALFDAGHYPLFAALTVLVFLALPDRGEWRRLVAAITLVAAAAALIEIGQPLVSRSRDLGDLGVGGLGIGVAAWGLHLWRRRSSRSARVVHAIVASGVMLALLVPVRGELQASVRRDVRFPLLGEFEDDLDLYLWTPRDRPNRARARVSLSDEHAAAGGRSLRVECDRGSLAGVLYDAGRLDWSRHDRLAWEVYNPGEPFELSVWVGDGGAYDWRVGFLGQVGVETGWNGLALRLEQAQSEAETRPLDTTGIASLHFYVGRDQPERLFFIDEVRLEAD